MNEEYNFFYTFARMDIKSLFFTALLFVLVSCHHSYEHKTVICIPVYGQSLALGEEAIRITDFDSLANYADGRIVTENLDHNYGYFDNDDIKLFVKKAIGYQKRSFELSSYSMAKMLADSIGEDSLICIFIGGQGTTALSHLGKGTEPYDCFLNNIRTAYNNAQERGWDFILPAICWMQGETDVVDYTGAEYRKQLLQFYQDINQDVRQITKQQQDVEVITYQTNCVTRTNHFDSLNYECPEAIVPQILLELARDHTKFHASGPLYPYNFVREAIHIDGEGHIQHGKLVAKAALNILRNQDKPTGLFPIDVKSQDTEITVDFIVPCPPLVLDTVQVTKAGHYGFSVITPDNRDIAKEIQLFEHEVRILCSEKPDSCKVRYAINGEMAKSGRLHGPRGNLRDSVGNWCWQFEWPL